MATNDADEGGAGGDRLVGGPNDHELDLLTGDSGADRFDDLNT